MMTIATDVIARLRERRRTAGIRQAELAPRIGVTESTLGRWERRRAEPSLADACAWAEELGLGLCLIERGPGSPP